MYTFKKFIKDWMLVLAIAAGIGIYLLYRALTPLHVAGSLLLAVCKAVQPVLLFAMLFLSFCKIEPHQMRPHKWMLWLLIVQIGLFGAIAGVVVIATRCGAAWIDAARIPLEAAMLCLVCPTATACAVVTGKLGGNMAAVVTYTVLINLAVAVAVPLVVPVLHPMAGLTFGAAFARILAKVFPLLIMPCLLAWMVRYLLPDLHSWLLRRAHWSFYIWTVSLTLAILMSTRAIVHSGNDFVLLGFIALSSLLACAFQFAAGKLIGARYGCRISAGQALGQKNTVFGIWMGYTFLDPVTSVAGGFYSLWHNIYNTWQLYRKRKENERRNGLG